VQVAFQYSLLTHRPPASAAEAATAVGGEVYALQRRLRVLTVAPSVAKAHDALYGGAALEPAVAMLTQKVLLHAVRDGAAEARALLQVRGDPTNAHRDCYEMLQTPAHRSRSYA
jgi:hypothetical protein